MSDSKLCLPFIWRRQFKFQRPKFGASRTYMGIKKIQFKAVQIFFSTILFAKRNYNLPFNLVGLGPPVAQSTNSTV